MAFTLGVNAQTHPNLEKGFAADKMYQFGDVDHVNLFNGNLSLTIPVGGSTPVSDHLSLSLTLVYNTKLWQAKPKTYGVAEQETNYLFYTPERRSNAGFGWTLTPGRLIDPSETDINNEVGRFIYLSPDGSDRLFYETLHEHGVGVSAEPSASGVLYSRDSTYLRLSVGGAGRILESPDGTIREFESYVDSLANTTCQTPPCAPYTRWRLKTIRDRFGNHIDIDYSTAQQWKITDQYQRATVVHFSPRSSDVDAEYFESVSSIDVPATGGGTATYTLSYEDKWVATGACDTMHPDTPLGYTLPLLTALALPDGTSYAFTYKGLDPNGDRCLVGGLESATLPTKAKISYTYTEYELPVSPCGLDPVALSAGIKTRVVSDPFNTGNDQTWEYVQTSSGDPSEPAVLCPGAPSVPAGPTEYINTVTVSTPAEAIAQKTRYYFSVWHVNRTALNGTTLRDYGLPFSRGHAFDTRFLSSEILDSGSTPVRSTYLSYTFDYFLAVASPFNARVSGSRTVFLDDDQAVSNAIGKHYIDTSYADFDGVGHYRTKTTTGTLSGATRTVTTPYNTIDSLVNPNALATGTYDSSTTGGTFVPPSTTAPWVLNLYPTSTTSETGTTSAVQEVCFNPSTGFVNGTRARGGASRANTDLVAIFASDSASTGGMAGAVTSEKYYGGDFSPLTSDPRQALCDTAAGTPGPVGYDIRHTYLHGVRATSEYYKDGSTVGFKFLDQADTIVNNQLVHGIDLSTGLTLHSRDTAQVETEFSYDTSRRVLTAKTGVDPTISYIYTPATSTGARVSISQTSATSGTPQAEFQYDGLGRLVLQSRTLPSAIAGMPRWTRQKTVYDAMGRRTQVSEFEESSSPSHFTTFSGFDRFGRPSTITKPDGKINTFQYHGVRQIERTSYLHTQPGADTAATATELYDMQGRLVQVKEPNDNTTTTYTYDVGGRLNTVSMTDGTTTQGRSFTYDNLGFLRSEHHPELGTTEHPELGTTDYDQYDARGHARKKTTGAANGIYDLRFTYDESERLTDVYDNGGARQLKHFVFATANTGINKQQGKLSQAERTNHLAAGDVLVTEKYKYESASGRTSSRETVVTNGTTTLQYYQQDFEYDDLGAITKPGYPTCPTTLPCGTTGLAGATFTYKDGSLISVPSYASSISYAGNMLSQVIHQNGVTDTYNQDATNGLSRPSSIAFTGWSGACAIPSAPVITAASQTCAYSAGNTASVPADTTVQYQWSISGGTITSTAANSIIYSTNGTSPVTLSVIASNTCGTSPAGTRNVTVAQRPGADVSGNATIAAGQSATIHVALTGVAPWTVTWNDLRGSPTQTWSASLDRIVSPQTTTTYTVYDVADANCTSGLPSGSAVVTVQSPLPAPASFSAITQDSNSRIVRLLWAGVQGATGYRMERKDCFSCLWLPFGPNPIAATTYDDLVPTTEPTAYLYQVIAVASGSSNSNPSLPDYAVTATTLFAEPVVTGTPIRGTHVQELRKAIDRLRSLANLPPYMTPTYADGWADYNPATGHILASHQTAMRTAVNEAAIILIGHTITFTGTVPASGVGISKDHINTLRTAVK